MFENAGDNMAWYKETKNLVSMMLAVAVLILLIGIPTIRSIREYVSVTVSPKSVGIGMDYTVSIRLPKGLEGRVNEVTVEIYSYIDRRTVETLKVPFPPGGQLNLTFKAGENYSVGLYGARVFIKNYGSYEDYFSVFSGALSARIEIYVPVREATVPGGNISVLFNATVKVYVVDNRSGRPLKDAIVWFSASIGSFDPEKGLTDASGYMESVWIGNFTGNKTVTFRVVAGKGGYNTALKVEKQEFTVYVANQSITNTTSG